VKLVTDLQNLESVCCINRCTAPLKVRYEFYDEIDSFYDGRQRLMAVYACKQCGLIFAKVHQTEDDRQHVDEVFFDETHLHEEGESKTIRDFAEVLERISEHGGSGRLLDIGCGTGYFLKFAQDRGWQVEGVEISKCAVQHTQRLGLKVKNMRLEEAHYPDSYFSAVTQLGLIEHVESPHFLLKETNRIMKPRGVLVIFTPNAGSLFHRLAHLHFKLTRSYFAIKKIYYSRHLYYFTKKSLTHVLHQEGFEIKKIQMVDLDMNKQFFQLWRKQKWARNRMLKAAAHFLLALARVTGMETHMTVYAVKK
jgi:2-polyprenyl-3-methyl-5-hydroxy-6-metoxy-1,4-benzoquinol methylase